jgi:hypothetical protein
MLLLFPGLSEKYSNYVPCCLSTLSRVLGFRIHFLVLDILLEEDMRSSKSLKSVQKRVHLSNDI